MTNLSQNANGITEEQVSQIREQIKQNKALAEHQNKVAEAIKRLYENEDFKLVVATEYFENEHKETAKYLAQNGNEDLTRRALIRLKAINCFREFLNSCEIKAQQSKYYVEHSESELLQDYLAQYQELTTDTEE